MPNTSSSTCQDTLKLTLVLCSSASITMLTLIIITINTGLGSINLCTPATNMTKTDCDTLDNLDKELQADKVNYSVALFVACSIYALHTARDLLAKNASFMTPITKIDRMSTTFAGITLGCIMHLIVLEGPLKYTIYSRDLHRKAANMTRQAMRKREPLSLFMLPAFILMIMTPVCSKPIQDDERTLSHTESSSTESYRIMTNETSGWQLDEEDRLYNQRIALWRRENGPNNDDEFDALTEEQKSLFDLV